MHQKPWLYSSAIMLFITLVVVISTILTAGYSYHDGAKSRREHYEKRGDIVWDIATDQKVIALTFDDGPMPKYLPQILEILKQYDAKATFFFIGANVIKYPNLAKKTAEYGHELGNHTFSHPSLKKLSSNELENEIERTQKTIFTVTGYTTKLFRPPGGAYYDFVVKASKETDHQMVLWSWDQDSKDWRRPGSMKIANKVIKNASNGDVVLFHDTQSQTLQALKIILPRLKEEGYRFVTISELIKLKKTPITPKVSRSQRSVITNKNER